MTNLCGHDRDVLIGALQHRTKTNRPLETTTRCGCSTCTTHRAVDDPAKLAEMLAARGRELDVERWEFAEWAGKVLCCFRRKLGAKVQESDTRELQPAQARAILLQWLRLPDGAREKAEKALRGET